MGILFVLMFYFVASSVLAVISSGIFRFLASRYLGRRAIEHKRAVRIAAIFPFACVLFAGMWFVAYATINSLVFHRDPMLGDGWSTDIPNGYAIEMIDVTDQGYLHPIGTDINSSSTFQGVRRLQIAGKQIYGTRDTNPSTILEQTARRKMSSLLSIQQAIPREISRLKRCCRIMPLAKALT